MQFKQLSRKSYGTTSKLPKRPSKLHFIVIFLSVLLFGSGLYILWLSLAQPLYMPPAKTWNTPVPSTPNLIEARLYIPKIKLNITYKSGDESVLNDNAWHRFPERGDPEKGGNFILSAHRFEIGLTPGETQRKSPFYYINKLEPGDKLYVDFNSKRYQYEVVERYSVKPSQIEVEAPSEEPKMTLYTCTLRGENDGREVIIARLMQKDVDPVLQL